MKIATWNVNSIKARLPHLCDWLRDAAPEVVLLQETKCVNDAFPRLEIEALGYNLALHGQKTYNGVAILSKYPLSDVRTGLAQDGEEGQARYIEALIDAPDPVRVASIYVPMGQAVGSDKFAYKLRFYDRLQARFAALLETEEACVMGGDYNVTVDDADVYDPDKLAEEVLCSTPERRKLRSLLYLGYTDAVRAFVAGGHHYSWWDYRGGAWNKDQGLRIDHLLCSPQAADRLGDAGIDRAPRGREKASDHTPVWCALRA